MAKIGDIQTSILLGDGDSIVVLVDPSRDIGEAIGSFGTPTYTIPVLTEGGRIASLRGGTRLLSAIQDALVGATTPVKLRVTAHGQARTTAREWEVKRL